MEVCFWGVRGSIPSPPTSSELKSKIERVLELAAVNDISTPEKRKEFLNSLSEREVGFLGGNTPCVELRVDNQILIFDMGSGIRELGDHLIKSGICNAPVELHIFIGHTHWDHLQGYPFFMPAYRSNVKINFYHVHPNLQERLEYQQEYRFFPVSLDFMASTKIYNQIELGSEFKIGEITVKNIELNHPGKSFCYKIEYKDKIFIYASDGEYNNLPTSRINNYIDFYRNADLLVFDAPYSFSEEIEKINWGHSSALVGIDLSVKAGVKNLALFHHAPENTDEAVFKLLDTALNYKEKNYPSTALNVFLARERMTFTL